MQHATKAFNRESKPTHATVRTQQSANLKRQSNECNSLWTNSCANIRRHRLEHTVGYAYNKNCG